MNRLKSHWRCTSVRLPRLSSPSASTVCRPGRGCGTCWPVRSVGSRTSRWRLPWNPPSPRWSRRPSATRTIPSTCNGRSTLYNDTSFNGRPFRHFNPFDGHKIWRGNLPPKRPVSLYFVVTKGFTVYSHWVEDRTKRFTIHYRNQNREQSVPLTSNVTVSISI